MSIPSTIADYLRHCSQELGERILKMYPALQAPGDPVSDRFTSLVAESLCGAAPSGDGDRKALERAKAAAVIAECGTGKTLMALSALHVHSAGRPYTALVMAPPNIVGKWCREVLITIPGARVFMIDGLRTPGTIERRPAWRERSTLPERPDRSGRAAYHANRSQTPEELEIGTRSMAENLPRPFLLDRWQGSSKAVLFLEAFLLGGAVRSLFGERRQSRFGRTADRER